MDTSKLAKDGSAPENPMGDVKVTGNATLGGEGLIDKTSGKTVSNLMNVKNDLKVFLTQMGMELPVKGTVTMKMTLVK